MAINTTLVVGYVVATMFGIGALLFGGRAIAVLRRPPTGEAGRELVFLTGRELVPALAIGGIALVIEWAEWIINGLRGAGILGLPSFSFYANIAQGLLLFVAGVMAYRVLVPYTRGQRQQQTRMILDRLAARVALLRGRR